MDFSTLGSLLGQGTLDTLYMIVVCTVVSYIIGLPIGVSLIVTAPGGIRPLGLYNKVVGFIVNILRSVPFLILMIALMPYIRKIIGTGIGKEAATAALIVAAAPFVARLVEQSLQSSRFSKSIRGLSKRHRRWEQITSRSSEKSCFSRQDLHSLTEQL